MVENIIESVDNESGEGYAEKVCAREKTSGTCRENSNGNRNTRIGWVQNVSRIENNIVLILITGRLQVNNYWLNNFINRLCTTLV